MLFLSVKFIWQMNFLFIYFFSNIPRDWSSMENIPDHTDNKVRYKSSGIRQTIKSFYLS